MGSFNFRDFITDLTIPMMDTENLYVLIIGQPSHSDLQGQNLNGISEGIVPVSFPLFGHYEDYGRFLLDDEQFKRENDFARAYLEAYDITLEENDVLDNHELKEQGLLLMATSERLYHRAIKESDMENTPYVYTFDDITLAEHFADTLFKGLDNVKEHRKALRNADAITDKEEKLTIKMQLSMYTPKILLPDVDGMGYVPFTASSTIAKFVEEDGKEDKSTIAQYLLNWICFYNFMTITGKMFKPIANLGSQSEEHEYTHLLKRLELEEAMRQHATYDNFWIDDYLNDLDERLRPLSRKTKCEKGSDCDDK